MPKVQDTRMGSADEDAQPEINVPEQKARGGIIIGSGRMLTVLLVSLALALIAWYFVDVLYTPDTPRQSPLEAGKPAPGVGQQTPGRP